MTYSVAPKGRGGRSLFQLTFATSCILRTTPIRDGSSIHAHFEDDLCRHSLPHFLPFAPLSSAPPSIPNLSRIIDLFCRLPDGKLSCRDSFFRRQAICLRENGFLLPLHDSWRIFHVSDWSSFTTSLLLSLPSCTSSLRRRSAVPQARHPRSNLVHVLVPRFGLITLLN